MISGPSDLYASQGRKCMNSASSTSVSKSTSICPQWWLRGALEPKMTRQEAAVAGSKDLIKEESEMPPSPSCDLQSLRPTWQPKPTELRIWGWVGLGRALFDIRARDRKTDRHIHEERQEETEARMCVHTHRDPQRDRETQTE